MHGENECVDFPPFTTALPLYEKLGTLNNHFEFVIASPSLLQHLQP